MKKFLKENKILVSVTAALVVVIAAVVIWLVAAPNSWLVGTDTGNAQTTVSPANTDTPVTQSAEGTATDVTTAAETASPDITTADVTTTEITTGTVVTTEDKPQVIVTPVTDTTAAGEGTNTPADTTADVTPGETEEPQTIETLEPVCAHKNTEVRDTRAATCAVAGFTGNTYCKDCGKLLTPGENTALAAHTPVTVNGVAASCVSTGLTDGSKCSVCNKVLVERSTIPAKGHTVVNIAEVPATCVSLGTTAGTKCSVCDTFLSGCEVIPYTDHTPVIDEAVAVTCTRNGLTEGSHCSVCNTVIVAQTVIPSSQSAHDFSVVSYTVAPQVGMVGYTVYKCSKCGAEDENGRDIVPMLEGDYAQQHRGDPLADMSNVHPPVETSPVESIDIYMSYELCPPDLTKEYDEELGRWYYVDYEQPAVIIARDGTPIYGEWVFDGGREEDTALGLPLPGWTFYMDFKAYPIGVSTYGWCYNKVYNTIVWGWWYWDSYGNGEFRGLDNVPGKTRASLQVDYYESSPDDAKLIQIYKRGR